MENSSVPPITRTLGNSQPGNSSPSDELPQDSPQHRTPVEAIVTFDGDIIRTRAHHVRYSRVNKQCLGFTLHAMSLTVALILGLVMMVVQSNNVGTLSFSFWAGIFSFAIGGFVPSPGIHFRSVDETHSLPVNGASAARAVAAA